MEEEENDNDETNPIVLVLGLIVDLLLNKLEETEDTLVDLSVLPVREFDMAAVVVDDDVDVDVDTELAGRVVLPCDRSAVGGTVAQYPSLNCRSSIAISPV